MNLPNCKRPCNNCPMRKDVKHGWLGADRMAEILAATTFVCHKTAHGNDADRRQCAGHMLLRGDKNDFVALAARMGIPTGLSGRGLIFDTEQDCIAHHDFSNA